MIIEVFMAFKDFFTTGIVFVCAVAEDVDSVINWTNQHRNIYKFNQVKNKSNRIDSKYICYKVPTYHSINLPVIRNWIMGCNIAMLHVQVNRAVLTAPPGQSSAHDPYLHNHSQEYS